MKKLISCITLIVFCSLVRAQNLDEAFKTVSNDLADKLVRKQVTHVGLIDFTDEDGKHDASVSYIQEQIEMNLINAASLQVMDRSHIVALLSEDKLLSDGLINESSVKRSVAFTKIDGWIIGKVTNSGGQFKLQLTVIEINTSQTFAVSQTAWLDAESLHKITAPKPCPYCKGTGSIRIFAKCLTCNGTGGPKCPSCGGSGRDFISVGLGGHAPCNVCQGKGKVACKVCNGTGRIVEYATCTKCNGTGIRN